MDHKEEFDVVTTPDGTGTLSITLACATVTEHYQRTTTTHSSVASDPAEVCSTGLRVYEGAQVLAAFLCRYGIGLLPPSVPSSGAAVKTALSVRPEAPCPLSVVELGCGCGLGGFTFDAVLRTCTSASSSPTSPLVSLLFTDASKDCLAMVRRSGEFAGRSVRDLNASPTKKVDPSTDASSSSGVRLSTFRLAWSAAGVQALRQQLPPCSGGAAQLVLGSDLMYYRVDVDALVHTAKLLLCAAETSPSPASVSDGLIVFSHFMRIADGQRKLASVARVGQNMRIASVPLTAFLDKETVHFRGWSGIEVVILSCTTPGDQRQCVRGDDEGREREDVGVLKALLEARAMKWENALALATSAAHNCAAARQARALAASLQPYPTSVLITNGSNVIGGDVAAADAAEEDAFLQLLL